MAEDRRISMTKKNIKKLGCGLLTCVILSLLCACKTKDDRTEIEVFVAASLNNVMTELVKEYEERNENVKIVINADSSGTLMTQIMEGYSCDIFFSAGKKQMDTLRANGFVDDDYCCDVVGNEVVIISAKGSNTLVRDIDSLDKATNLALAAGSVPIGMYTRNALMNKGILAYRDDPDSYTSLEVSKALGNIEISEQSNASKVLRSVIEKSCEVGTVYYSDIYGFEKDIDVIDVIDSKLTGEVNYPVALIRNSDASSEQKMMARDFWEYITSDEAKAVYERYYFKID